MTQHSSLAERLLDRAHEDGETPGPLLTAADLARAEQALGFALHPLLAAVYQQVGDGGFGPDYQVLPLIDGEKETAVGAYLQLRADGAGTEWAWPEGVLPILDWGCGMYACVDCRSGDGMVVLFEPNPGDPDLAWYVEAASLAGWLTGHLEDTGWWILTENGEDTDLPAWSHAKERAV
ncbi:SMI1/KNR4 family protein [Longispora urticae]